MDEPKHPTYGTLDEFLAELRADIARGYYIRIGQQGALNWYAEEFSRIRHVESGIFSKEEMITMRQIYNNKLQLECDENERRQYEKLKKKYEGTDPEPSQE